MSKTTLGVLAVGGCLAIFAVVGIAMFVSYNNEEIGLRNTIKAKQVDNTSEYDNMFKKIAQVAEVTDEQKNALKEIFVEHAAARAGTDDASLMKWITESVPNVDVSTYKNLQNIITGSRDRWTMRQKELLDLKRRHDNLLQQIPGSFFLAGRESIDVQIVTSSRSEKAFETGTDDDIKVFNKD